MRAKYATECEACGGRIHPGEEIDAAGKGPRTGWKHVGCQAALFDDPSVPGVVADRAGPTSLPRTGGAPTTVAGSRAKAQRRARPLAEPPPPGATAVYTDGSCSGNPGPGGWAWAVADGRQASGGANSTTNQRMEVQAALEAVRALDDSPLVVVSDSTYVVNCFRDGWWRGWRTRGWRNSAKQPVANRDLWEPLVDLVERRGDVTFRWVKGHSGDPMNDLVDLLAVQATAAQGRAR